MADKVWKVVKPLVIGRSEPISQSKFFDPSTPSMRTDGDGENTSLAAPGALANRLQRGTARKANEANLDPPNQKSEITSLL